VSSSEIDSLVQLLAKLPGLGPRSARRAALHLIKRKDTLLGPLAAALAQAASSVRTCGICGNLDTTDPCGICIDNRRDRAVICIVRTSPIFGRSSAPQPSRGLIMSLAAPCRRSTGAARKT